ncbi:MAG TPA: NusG domain II-containing protein [Methylophilaceae bacterium]|nr:NusG domain II-containing protein [Methylophilaceae bacterium]
MNSSAYSHKPLIGDCIVMIGSLLVVILLFQTLWTNSPASRLQVRMGNKIIGTYDLNQNKELHIDGPLGESQISISQGKVRFKQSPCNNQYCVHQGWLNRAGQVAVCLPNQVSIQLIGENKPYDSLNY